MKKGLIASLTSICLLVGLAAPAHAQMDARDDPRATGGLSEPAKTCSRHAQRSAGKVVAIARFCAWAYFVSPDSSATDDYLMVWMQGTLNPKPGWCATRLKLDVFLDFNQSSYMQTVPGPADVKRSRAKTVAMVSAGAEGYSDPGTLSQDLTYVPGRYRPSTKNTEDGRRFRMKWSGSTAKTVALVSGAEIEFDYLLGQPNFVTAAGLRIKRSRSC